MKFNLHTFVLDCLESNNPDKIHGWEDGIQEVLGTLDQEEVCKQDYKKVKKLLSKMGFKIPDFSLS